MKLFSRRVFLSTLANIDRNIIYRDGDTSHNVSPYTYAVKIIDLNRDRLQKKFGVRTVYIEYDHNAFIVRGEVRDGVMRAVEAIERMLCQPAYSLVVDPTEVVTLRILKEDKKEFSSRTGCWLHFIWANRTASCYGLDGESAEAYVQGVCTLVRMCNLRHPSTNQIVHEERFARKFKNLVKKYVDYVEKESGAKMAIQHDHVESGEISVQLFGTEPQVGIAVRILHNQIFTRPTEEMQRPGHFPATALAPGDAPIARQPPKQRKRQRRNKDKETTESDSTGTYSCTSPTVSSLTDFDTPMPSSPAAYPQNSAMNGRWNLPPTPPPIQQPYHNGPMSVPGGMPSYSNNGGLPGHMPLHIQPPAPHPDSRAIHLQNGHPAVGSQFDLDNYPAVGVGLEVFANMAAAHIGQWQQHPQQQQQHQNQHRQQQAQQLNNYQNPNPMQSGQQQQQQYPHHGQHPFVQQQHSAQHGVWGGENPVSSNTHHAAYTQPHPIIPPHHQSPQQPPQPNPPTSSPMHIPMDKWNPQMQSLLETVQSALQTFQQTQSGQIGSPHARSSGSQESDEPPQQHSPSVRFGGVAEAGPSTRPKKQPNSPSGGGAMRLALDLGGDFDRSRSMPGRFLNSHIALERSISDTVITLVTGGTLDERALSLRQEPMVEPVGDLALPEGLTLDVVDIDTDSESESGSPMHPSKQASPNHPSVANKQASPLASQGRAPGPQTRRASLIRSMSDGGYQLWRGAGSDAAVAQGSGRRARLSSIASSGSGSFPFIPSHHRRGSTTQGPRFDRLATLRLVVAAAPCSEEWVMGLLDRMDASNVSPGELLEYLEQQRLCANAA